MTTTMNSKIKHFVNKTDQRVHRLLSIKSGLNVEQIAEILGIERHIAIQSVMFLCGLGEAKQNEPTYSLK